jgi:hypothetical protein
MTNLNLFTRIVHYVHLRSCLSGLVGNVTTLLSAGPEEFSPSGDSSMWPAEQHSSLCQWQILLNCGVYQNVTY